MMFPDVNNQFILLHKVLSYSLSNAEFKVIQVLAAE